MDDTTTGIHIDRPAPRFVLPPGSGTTRRPYASVPTPPPPAALPDSKERGAAATGKPEHAGLLPPTERWLGRLPVAARPVKLTIHYPRVANLLCALWRRPTEFGEYMDELLFYETTLGQRAGFPSDVVKELFVLRLYYDRLPPAIRDS
jgi:hypothetical protein